MVKRGWSQSKKKLDLVLCDVDLPIISGFEMLERLIDIAPRFGRMPFVFMTRQTDRKHELEGRQLGADDYIKKPIDFDILAAFQSQSPRLLASSSTLAIPLRNRKPETSKLRRAHSALRP
jgi:DNA-binding response OmpR family regulator